MSVVCSPLRVFSRSLSVAASCSSSNATSAPPSRAQVLALYRSLARSARLFSSHNYRDYVQRRTRDAFRASAAERDPTRLSELFAEGQKELIVARRQGWINSQFKTDKSVVEFA
ncbi:hypothetical protein HKX48_000064 [Thoreauomyces humboldtii]|nr:hypothetical protein HKX48_000064 [Thoreauomyces humboldtii]